LVSDPAEEYIFVIEIFSWHLKVELPSPECGLKVRNFHESSLELHEASALSTFNVITHLERNVILNISSEARIFIECGTLSEIIVRLIKSERELIVVDLSS
jgi:hypothetical protein